MSCANLHLTSLPFCQSATIKGQTHAINVWRTLWTKPKRSLCHLMILPKSIQTGHLWCELLRCSTNNPQGFRGHVTLFLPVSSMNLEECECATYKNWTRGNSIYSNSQRTTFIRGMLRQSNQCVLCRCICPHIRYRYVWIDWGDIDNRSFGTLLFHLLHLIFYTKRCSSQSDIHRSSPDSLIELHKRSFIRVMRGIIDRDIQLSVFVDGLGDEVLSLIRVGNICFDEYYITKGR